MSRRSVAWRIHSYAAIGIWNRPVIRKKRDSAYRAPRSGDFDSAHPARTTAIRIFFLPPDATSRLYRERTWTWRDLECWQHTLKFGGASRNRTDVQGFAILCMTTLPSRQTYDAEARLQAVYTV